MVKWILQVAFPSLELLNISGLDNVEKIWHNQLLEDSFSQLKEIRVASCGKLLNIFPSSMLNKLQSLQFLRAVDYSSLEVVYDMEWINVKEAVTTTVLSKLVLYFLPSLKHIWNKDPYGILTFQNLKLLEVGHCQSLKYLFPASLVSVIRVKIFAYKIPTFQEVHLEGNVDITIQQPRPYSRQYEFQHFWV